MTVLVLSRLQGKFYDGDDGDGGDGDVGDGDAKKWLLMKKKFP